ncbi:MAG: ribosome silencing factor [Bernardetiaceae bacterium]|nr:ribosome silencing factor [Bernardetiaceae bacterium]
MIKTQQKTSNTLCNTIIEGMQERKAKDITVLDLRKVQKAVADFFVICTGTSDTHVDAIRLSVEGFTHKKTGESPWHTEGLQTREWIILDYVDVVVHVFQADKRDYYALEELWGDAHIKRIEDIS